jgi:hypothetical protein
MREKLAAPDREAIRTKHPATALIGMVGASLHLMSLEVLRRDTVTMHKCSSAFVTFNNDMTFLKKNLPRLAIALVLAIFFLDYLYTAGIS